VGLAPGVGEWADALNSAWYLHEGRLVESVLSASATVPGLGIGATVSKWFGRTDRISNADDLIEATQFSELTLGTFDTLRRNGLGELAEAAAPQLRLAGQLRVETTARLKQILDTPGLLTHEGARRDIVSTINALTNNLKDKDLSGRLQELRGIPTRFGHDHIEEVRTVINSLEKSKDRIVNQLQSASPTFWDTQPDGAALSNAIDVIDILIQQVQHLDTL